MFFFGFRKIIMERVKNKQIKATFEAKLKHDNWSRCNSDVCLKIHTESVRCDAISLYEIFKHFFVSEMILESEPNNRFIVLWTTKLNLKWLQMLAWTWDATEYFCIYIERWKGFNKTYFKFGLCASSMLTPKALE